MPQTCAGLLKRTELWPNASLSRPRIFGRKLRSTLFLETLKPSLGVYIERILPGMMIPPAPLMGQRARVLTFVALKHARRPSVLPVSVGESTRRVQGGWAMVSDAMMHSRWNDARVPVYVLVIASWHPELLRPLPAPGSQPHS